MPSILNKSAFDVIAECRRESDVTTCGWRKSMEYFRNFVYRKEPISSAGPQECLNRSASVL
jgi:hypothetical protein